MGAVVRERCRRRRIARRVVAHVVACGVISHPNLLIQSSKGRCHARAKVSSSLSGGGRASLYESASNIAIPFLVPPEKQLILLDGAGYVVAPVIAAKLWLGSVVQIIEEIICIDFVVAAFVERAAMELILTRPRGEADDGAGCLAVFR